MTWPDELQERQLLAEESRQLSMQSTSMQSTSAKLTSARSVKRVHHRVKWSLIVLEIAALVFIPLEYFVFVNPPSDAVQPAPVVVVLGGNAYRNRIAEGIRLASENPETVLLISSYKASYCPWAKRYPTLHITCFRANPYTTQGEARYASSIAHKLGASSLDVVDSADQLIRARLRFSRCWAGELRMIEAPASNSSVVHLIPYQTAAMVKALVLQRTC